MRLHGYDVNLKRGKSGIMATIAGASAQATKIELCGADLPFVEYGYAEPPARASV